jgi:NAD(P)-dependent dehydrogenase (short-subunit alcohol dehydrogenase family)
MTGWLVGKRARLIGDAPSIARALSAHGVTLIKGEDADVVVHVSLPPVVRPAQEIGHAEWRAALDAGLDQRFHIARALAEACRARGSGGAVIFVGAPEQALGADHAAAAGALGNLTKTLAVEWARDGVRVNTVLTRQQGATLGNLVAYLASDYAAYVTGAVMGVDCDDD